MEKHEIKTRYGKVLLTNTISCVSVIMKFVFVSIRRMDKKFLSRFVREKIMRDLGFLASGDYAAV